MGQSRKYGLGIVALALTAAMVYTAEAQMALPPSAQNPPTAPGTHGSMETPVNWTAPDSAVQTSSFLPGSGGNTDVVQLAAPGTTTQLQAPAPVAPGDQPQELPPPRPLPGPQGGLLGPPPGAAVGFRYFTVAPRYGSMPQMLMAPQPDGRDAIIIVGGVIVTVYGVDRFGTLDLEADRVVVWTRGGAAQQVMQGMQQPGGQDMHDLEFYLAGHVEMRQQLFKHIPGTPVPVLEQRTMRAGEMYYNVDRNVALAYHVEMETIDPSLLQPFVVKAEQLEQLSPTFFEMEHADISASRLPSDPGVSIQVNHATLEERMKIQRGLLGPVIDPQTGQPAQVEELWVRSQDILFYAENVPFFYLPYLATDARDPLGPVTNVLLGYNKIFGFQVGVTVNTYELLGISALPGTTWKSSLDYLSKRGPAANTEFDWNSPTFLGMKAVQEGSFQGNYIHDKLALDILGGQRPGDPANLTHPANRGDIIVREGVYQLPFGFSWQAAINYQSDKNYLEQYDKQEFDTGYNRETFFYLKQQQCNWDWNFLVNTRWDQPWVTETDWLPRATGHIMGQSADAPILDWFTLNANVDVGYAELRPSQVPSFPVMVTQKSDNTARVDLNEELSLPLPTDKIGLGDLRVVPYVMLDNTYYSRDLTGNDSFRTIVSGGVRSSFPLSHLYPDVSSDLLYLNGLYHKIVFSSNYYVAQSNQGFFRYPQLDPMFDQAEDQALNDIRPFETTYNPTYGNVLATSPIFDPQLYALRTLLMNSVDTRDSMEVLQGDIRQRWQTKRGYPGQEHTVDWMTLDLSASFYPDANRDNFGSHWAFLQYDWTWNIGDRTSLVSTGWLDPYTNGPSMFTVGAYFNRPDRTNFFLGFRDIPLLESRAVTAAVTYIFSPKYAVTLSSVYDFGTSTSLTNSLVVTRVGKDLQLSFGISYNAILNNFGVVFEIIPNISSRIKSRYLPVTDPRLTALQ